MTLFEKLIHRILPSDIVFEDDDVFAFRDIAPQAPIHILVVPKIAITRISESQVSNNALLGTLLGSARDIAQKLNIAEAGYRIVINNGKNAGEAVPHLHLHLLAGRKLNWPPG
jgi:histidine triad (HIT) family protein